MTDTIVFYHNPYTRARVVHWMLEEVGAPYRIEVIDLDKREHKCADYLAVNPMGKVPAIQHRGTVVTEAAAICAYLADAFPGAALAPASDAPERGSYLRWLFFAATCVDASVVDTVLKRASDDVARIVGYGTHSDVLDTLDGALSASRYLSADRFTAADLFMAAQLDWALMTAIVAPRPSFKSYVARCTDRPAYWRSQSRCEELGTQLDLAAEA